MGVQMPMSPSFSAVYSCGTNYRWLRLPNSAVSSNPADTRYQPTRFVLRRMRTWFLACLLLAGMVVGAHANERRIALVVGASAYQHANRLPNTLNDAQA